MADSTEYTVNLRGYYAGFVTRLVAFIADLLIIVVVGIFLSFIANLVASFLGVPVLMELLQGDESLAAAPLRQTMRIVVITALINALILIVYQVFFWVVAGKTPGKALVGLRVVPEHGTKMTIRQAIVRAVGYYISALPVFIGFLVVLVNEDRRSWHDRLANTYVLYDWDARLGRRMLARLGISRPDLVEAKPTPAVPTRPRRTRPVDSSR